MRWAPVTIHQQACPTILEIDGIGVVRLIDRLDGTWFALLDYHKAGHIHRACTSLEAGRRGSELWAERHMTRLVAEVAAKRASRSRHPAVARAEATAAAVVDADGRAYEAERARLHAMEVQVTPRPPRRRR